MALTELRPPARDWPFTAKPLHSACTTEPADIPEGAGMAALGTKPKPTRSKSTSASEGSADMMRARYQVSS